ncbi:MAG: 4Fe-4S binding protein [Saccharofermentanales bacterium]|jgi:polyferredoxin
MNAPETPSKSEPVIRPKDRKSLSSRKFPVRLAVQIFFFGLIGLIAVNHSLSENGGGIPFLSNASLHAICPFGGVETTYQLLSLGTYVQKVHAGSVVLMAIVFFLAILFGPVFCGWVCPLGSFQEWVGKLGRKLLGRRFGRIIPARLDRALRWFRLPFLVWVVYVTARSGTLLFANLDPYHALFNFWTSEVAPVSLIVLGVTAALSLVVARPWCRYACPYGALLGLFNKVRIFKIRRQASTCINCSRCDRACPMDLDISHQSTVTSMHCISCYECTSERACPVPDTVTMQVGQPKASIQPQKEVVQ